MKRIISVICVLFSLLSLSAQETYQKETFISSRGDTLPYRLLRPETMKTGEKYPWYFSCMAPENVAAIMKDS